MSRPLILASGQQVAIDSIDVNLPPSLITLFGRMRSADNPTQIQFRQNTAQRSLLLTEGQVSGSGTSSSFNANSASTVLTVGTSVGLRRLRTRTAGLYIAGNSLLCLITFNFEGTGQANVTKRVGYFDDNNGIYLRQINGQLAIVLRSSSTGSLVETVVSQDNWGDPSEIVNTSKFDGNDTIGYDFDPSKCHIFWIALEWLGVGDVYTGFVKDADFIVANVFRNPNQKTLPYMGTADLFPSYEIERTQLGGTSENLRAICCTLQSEGTDTRSGFLHSIKLSSDFVTLNSTTVFYVLMSLRLNPSYINARVLAKTIKYIVSDNSTTEYELLLVKNPTFTGAYTPSWTSSPNSSIQYQENIGTSVTVANDAWEKIVAISITNSSANVASTTEVNADIPEYFGSSYDGTPEIFALIIRASSQSVTIKRGTFITLWEQL